MSELEEKLAQQMEWAGLEPAERNYKFALPKKRSEFDFAWPEHKVAIEVDGGLHLGKRGGHSSKAGITRDIEKGNLALLLGWRMFRATSAMVHSGEALRLAQEVVPAAAAGGALYVQQEALAAEAVPEQGSVRKSRRSRKGGG